MQAGKPGKESAEFEKLMLRNHLSPQTGGSLYREILQRLKSSILFNNLGKREEERFKHVSNLRRENVFY